MYNGYGQNFIIRLSKVIIIIKNKRNNLYNT